MFTGDISGDDVRWQKGYIVIIRNIGPHCYVIMSLHAFYKKSLPVIFIGV